MEEQRQQEEAGYLVTDILQRRLADLAISDTPLRQILTDLQADHIAPDVVFHVSRTSHNDPPSAAIDEHNLLRVLAHSSLLRKESDYFREILQRQPSYSISADDDTQSGASVKQENVGHFVQQDCASTAENSSQASNYSNLAEWDSTLVVAPDEDLMYVSPNYADTNEDYQEKQGNPNNSNGTVLASHSVAASTVNDIVGREVLAHLQAKIMTRPAGQAAVRPSDQGFHSCKSSFLSAEVMGKKDEQAGHRLSNQEYHRCKPSFSSADATDIKNEQAGRRLSDQEYHSCKSSFMLVDGMDLKDEQAVRPLLDQDYHSCKSSFVSADGDVFGQGRPEIDHHSSSACSMGTSATSPSRPEGVSASSSRASLQPQPSNLAARKSILLGDEERKGFVSKSMRKSVRFSLEPAGIILPASLTINIGRNDPDSTRQIDKERANQSAAEIPSNKPMENYVEGSSSVVEPVPPERINKPLIKRRHTEVNMIMERGSANNMPSEDEEDAYSFRYYVVKKLTWTAPVLIGIMEWIYMGMCHINLEDLPGLYDAAYRAVITSLTWCIRRHSMPEYLNLALSSLLHCKHLLKLCLVADCAELSSLKGFCEALQAIGGQPKIVILETEHLLGSRIRDFLAEGFFVLDGHPLCVLKTSRTNEFESPRGLESSYGELFVEDGELPTVLTFARHLQPGALNCTSLSNCESSQGQAWKVVLLDNDSAGSFYAFFRYASVCSLRSVTKKGRSIIFKKLARNRDGKHVGLFKLQMITRFKVGSILVESLSKAISQGLSVREKRGSGSFIKGPSYCTSIVIKGDPWKVLMAAKAIPYDMVGRSALKIRAPCAKTFSSLFHASHTCGVELHSQSVVLVKPLYVLIKVLEFLANLNVDAYEAPSTERTFIELCQPTEPF